MVTVPEALAFVSCLCTGAREAEAAVKLKSVIISMSSGSTWFKEKC